MAKTSKGGLAPSAVALAVHERLGLCAELLALREKQTGTTDPVRGRVLAMRRAAGIRTQLLPWWRPSDSAAHAFAQIDPARVRGEVGQELAKVLQDGTPAQKSEAGLKAADILQLARLMEAEEVEQGLMEEGSESGDLTGLIRSVTEVNEPEDTPDYMRGHTHARESMYRAIEDGGFGASVIDLARVASSATEYQSLEEFDPQGFARMNEHSIENLRIIEEMNALRATPLEDSEQAREERAAALERMQALLDAVDEKWTAARNDMFSRRSAKAESAKVAKAQAMESMRHTIEGFKERSGVSEKAAKSWAQGIEIPPEVEAALRKGGYTAAQVRKDAAEFFRFVRGRVQKLRFALTQSDRASANRPHGAAGIINIPASGRGFNKRVLWHELGHHLESEPSAAAAARLFIRMRSEAGKQDKLSTITGIASYEDAEIAFVDHFFDPYMGKIYAHGSTEIFSMVLESFSDPALLAERLHKDPQSFAFVRGFIDRPRDALEQLQMAMLEDARLVNEEAKKIKAEAKQRYAQRMVAQAGFTKDATDYLSGSAYAGVVRKVKGKPIGFVPEPGQAVLIYEARVVKESTMLLKGAGKNGKDKFKKVRTTIDGFFVVIANGVLGEQLLVRYMSSFLTNDLNWVLAYLIRWRENGFDAGSKPDPVKVSSDLDGMDL